jgi:hypothetical protein
MKTVKKKSRMTTIMMNTTKTREKIIIKKVVVTVILRVIDLPIKKHTVVLNMKKKMMTMTNSNYNLVT